MCTFNFYQHTKVKNRSNQICFFWHWKCQTDNLNYNNRQAGTPGERQEEDFQHWSCYELWQRGTLLCHWIDTINDDNFIQCIGWNICNSWSYARFLADQLNVSPDCHWHLNSWLPVENRGKWSQHVDPRTCTQYYLLQGCHPFCIGSLGRGLNSFAQLGTAWGGEQEVIISR